MKKVMIVATGPANNPMARSLSLICLASTSSSSPESSYALRDREAFSGSSGFRTAAFSRSMRRGFGLPAVVGARHSEEQPVPQAHLGRCATPRAFGVDSGGHRRRLAAAFDQPWPVSRPSHRDVEPHPWCRHAPPRAERTGVSCSRGGPATARVLATDLAAPFPDAWAAAGQASAFERAGRSRRVTRALPRSESGPGWRSSPFCLGIDAPDRANSTLAPAPTPGANPRSTRSAG